MKPVVHLPTYQISLSIAKETPKPYPKNSEPPKANFLLHQRQASKIKHKMPARFQL